MKRMTMNEQAWKTVNGQGYLISLFLLIILTLSCGGKARGGKKKILSPKFNDFYFILYVIMYFLLYFLHTYDIPY